jgi:hypothetical protein
MRADCGGGLVVDVRVGETLRLRPPGGEPIVLTVEAKSGQRSRIRIQSSEQVLVDVPRASAAGGERR